MPFYISLLLSAFLAYARSTIKNPNSQAAQRLKVVLIELRSQIDQFLSVYPE